MKKAPTIITGTVGMDAHVIGTKVVSRSLKDAGYDVVELGMQVSLASVELPFLAMSNFPLQKKRLLTQLF